MPKTLKEKVVDAIKVVKATKTVEKKPEVCTNCNASGLKCSVCGAGDVV